MSDRAYRDMYFEDPQVQAEFEQLIEKIHAAEQDRQPIAERHAQAERDFDSGALSNAQFREIDKDYIAANNAIAAAQRAVDAFLNSHHNYRVRS